MVVDSMTWKELSNEIIEDFNESHIMAKWKTMKSANIRKYSSALSKGLAKSFKPVLMKSKRGNNFYIIPIAVKSEYSKISILNDIYVSIVHYKNHLWAGVIAKDKGVNFSTFFSNHLFCRYEERFNHKEEIDNTFLQRISDFLFRNGECCGQERKNPVTGETEYFCLYEDGIILGDIIDGVMVFRTYITFDMLHEDQWKSYRSLVDTFNQLKEQNKV